MDRLINDLRKIFEDNDDINTETIKILLENYKTDPNDWSQYAHFDPHKYTRNLVDIGNGKYNLMILCWGPGMASSIHDHTDSHCFVKVLHGSLRETRYTWPKNTKRSCDGNTEKNDEDRPMNQISVEMYSTNGVTYISDHIGLHRMENPSHSETAITLHLYIPPYNHCEIFDERTGKHVKALVTFYTKYGKRVNYNKNDKNDSILSIGTA